MKRVLRTCGLVAGGLLVLAIAVVAWARFSVVSEEVAYRSGALTLRGTLLTPRGGEPSPAVVLVHGSGQVSRKSMLAYAWIFALHGHAALAYDKRGVGESDGPADAWRAFSFDDLAHDAVAGYRFLQARPDIDARRVGFFGASQGGWVVALAAHRVQRPAFMIMASASLSTVAEDRLHGRMAQVRHAGFDARAARDAVALLRLDHAVTRTGRGYDELVRALAAHAHVPWYREVYGSAPPIPPAHPARRWERTVLDFDPQPLLAAQRAPVLWIFGDPALDRFSPVALSVARVRAAAGRGMPYALHEIPGAGHTLELEGRSAMQTMLQARLPLVLAIFDWLDRVDP